jgi:hypothetical protein
MYIEIEDLKKHVKNTVSMEEYAGSLKKNEPTIILRNYEEPKTPPYLESGINIFDFDKNRRPSDDVKNAYGTRPNVPGITVVNSIKEALGAGGYAIHISDGSYTGYSAWELQEFLKNFVTVHRGVRRHILYH